MTIFDRWKVTSNELSEIVKSNPSLRGMVFGYIGEYKLRKMLSSDSRVTNVLKPDNHYRGKKGDLIITYKDVEIAVEVKSLQTITIKKIDSNYIGKFQCDASDRRKVILPNGQSIETTCLLVGEFDLLAVNLFGFQQGWKFAFAKNEDLPRSKYHGYTSEQRQYLFATLMEVTWPLQSPFKSEPFQLLDEIIRDKEK